MEHTNRLQLKRHLQPSAEAQEGVQDMCTEQPGETSSMQMVDSIHAAHIRLGLEAVMRLPLLAGGAQLLVCMCNCLQDSMQAVDK